MTADKNSRRNCKFSRRWSNYSSRNPTATRDWSRKSCNKQQRTMTIRISGTEPTFTGVCCQETSRLPRFVNSQCVIIWRVVANACINQSIILSQKPAISSTISSLPPALLEQLLGELSTLASVYHKPPESFMGKGRFGADEIQRAAIQEQRREAAENPIAATVAAAAAANGGSQSQSNMENLLDIDFDGSAPASAEQSGSVPATPDRVDSPAVGPGGASGGMADMMGLFDMGSSGAASSSQPPAMGGGMGDIMNGFAGMDISGTSAPPPPGQQLHPQGTGSQPQQGQSSGSAGDDLLGLF